MGEYNAYASLEEHLKPYHISKKEISNYIVSKREVKEIVNFLERQKVILNKDPVKNGKPTFNVIAGAPGSGKGRLIKKRLESLSDKSTEIISLDEYRIYHPKMKKILKRLKKNPTIFNFITSQFAYEVEEEVIKRAMEKGSNIILEVSLNSPDAVNDLIDTAREKEYGKIEIDYMATGSITSRLSAQNRFEIAIERAKKEQRTIKGIKKLNKRVRLQSPINIIKSFWNSKDSSFKENDYSDMVPRYVNSDYHNSAYSKMIEESIYKVEPKVDTSRVHKRGEEEPKQVYDSSQKDNIYASALHAVREIREEDNRKNLSKNLKFFNELKTRLYERQAKPEEYELLNDVEKDFPNKEMDEIE